MCKLVSQQFSNWKMSETNDNKLFKDINLFLVSVLLLYLIWEFLMLFLHPWLISNFPEFELFTNILILLFTYASFAFMIWLFKKILQNYYLFGSLTAIFFPLFYFIYKFMTTLKSANIFFLIIFANSFILLGLLITNFKQIKKS